MTNTKVRNEKADAIWIRLSSGEVPAFGALEELMESSCCERADAIAMLHVSAGRWLEDANCGEIWNSTPSSIAIEISDGATSVEFTSTGVPNPSGIQKWVEEQEVLLLEMLLHSERRQVCEKWKEWLARYAIVTDLLMQLHSIP